MNTLFSPKDIDAVLFDMDGTLVDTDDVDVQKWAKQVEQVVKTTPEMAAAAAHRFVMAIETPVNSLLTMLDAVGLDNFVISLAIKLYGIDEDKPMPPIHGIETLIPALALNFKLGIVSTRTVATTEKFLSDLNLRDYFQVIGGRDTTKRIKPHPEPILSAASRLGVGPARCLMIGDTTVDVRSARRAGVYACAVLCGFGERNELEKAGAQLILANTNDIRSYLLPEREE